MQKLFSFQFSANIWRVLPDAINDANRWAVELRGGEEKTVSFAILDGDSGRLLWEASPFGTDWWSSMTAFSANHLFLHNYRYPEIPEPTDLLMLSGNTGEVQWVLPNHILVETLTAETLRVATKRGDQVRYLECNADTGLCREELSTAKVTASKIILKEPIRYKEGNKYFEELADFIREYSNGEAPVIIDYIDRKPYLMFSYYIYEHNKIAEYLLVVTENGECVFQDKLSEGRDGMGKSTMLLRGDTLVYLKNNKEFVGLLLN